MGNCQSGCCGDSTAEEVSTEQDTGQDSKIGVKGKPEKKQKDVNRRAPDLNEDKNVSSANI
jgi:hypothetical protein